MGCGQGMGMGGGRGMGRGMGGGQGMGMGGGRGVGRGMAAGLPGGVPPMPSAWPEDQQQAPAAGVVSNEQELATLKEQADIMGTQLNEIHARIRDLDKNGQRAGLIAYVEEGTCNGCSACLSVCPVNAIALVDNVAQIDITRCTGCGICVAECPRKAISLRKK